MGENLKEDTFFEALAQLTGVALAVADQAVEKAELPYFAVDGVSSGKECGGAEKIPEVAEGEFAMFRWLGQGLLQVDFVVVGGTAVSLGRV